MKEQNLKGILVRTLLLAAAAITLSTPALAINPPAPTAVATPALSTATTDLGTLLDNPKAKEVLVKYIPAVVSNPQIEMARSMTLKQIQGFAVDQLTDDVLAKIDADLAAIAPAG
jgi:hypothetical protein